MTEQSVWVPVEDGWDRLVLGGEPVDYWRSSSGDVQTTAPVLRGTGSSGPPRTTQDRAILGSGLAGESSCRWRWTSESPLSDWSDVQPPIISCLAEFCGRDIPELEDSLTHFPEEGVIGARWANVPLGIAMFDSAGTNVLRIYTDSLVVGESNGLMNELNLVNAGIQTARVYWESGRLVVVADAVWGATWRPVFTNVAWSVGSLAAWLVDEFGSEVGGTAESAAESLLDLEP